MTIITPDQIKDKQGFYKPDLVGPDHLVVQQIQDDIIFIQGFKNNFTAARTKAAIKLSQVKHLIYSCGEFEIIFK